MPANATSRAMLDLLDQQRKQADLLDKQHKQDAATEEQRWQQRRLWHQQNNQSAELQMRSTQRDMQKVMAELVKMGKASQGQLDLMKQTHRSDTLQARHQRQAKLLGEYHQHKAKLGGQQTMHDFMRADLQARHGAERFGLHEKQQQQREREKEAKQESRERERQRRARPGKFQAALDKTGAALKTGANIANTMQNPFLTQSQQMEKVYSSLPVVGQVMGGLFEFKNALSGVTNEMMKLSVASRMVALGAASLREKETVKGTYEFQEAQAVGRGAAHNVSVPALRGLGQNLVGFAGKRDTYQGERAYQFASIRYGAQVQLERAQAEARAAKHAVEHTERDLTGAHVPFRGVGSRVGVRLALRGVEDARAATEKATKRDANRGLFDPGFWNGAGQREVGHALLEEQKAQEHALNQINRLQQDIRRQQEARVTLAEKERQLGMAQVNVLKAEQQILAQKEQSMAKAAHSLGNMNPAQRAWALASVKMAMKSKDIGTLPPMLRQMAQQVAPDMMNKLAERSGMGTKEYKELQRLGAVDKGDLAAVRKEQAKIQATVDVKVSLNEAEFARKVGESINASLKALVKSIEDKLTVEAEAMRRGMQQRNVVQ